MHHQKSFLRAFRILSERVGVIVYCMELERRCPSNSHDKMRIHDINYSLVHEIRSSEENKRLESFLKDSNY